MEWRERARRKGSGAVFLTSQTIRNSSHAQHHEEKISKENGKGTGMEGEGTLLRLLPRLLSAQGTWVQTLPIAPLKRK